MDYNEIQKLSEANQYNPYTIPTQSIPMSDQSNKMSSYANQPTPQKKESSGKDSGTNWGAIANLAGSVISLFSDKNIKEKAKNITLEMLKPKKVSENPIENSMANPQHHETTKTALLIDGYTKLNDRLDKIISFLEGKK